MNYEITPQVGFGPIKFGAAPEEIQDILGKPVKLQKSRIFDDDDEDEVYFKARRHSAWYGKAFPDETDLQVTYEDDKAVIITLFKRSKPLIYKGANLHKFKIRQDVLEGLAKDEDTYYYDEQGYFFPKSGLVVPTPKHMKRFFFIQLVLTENQMPRLEFDMYEPSTALD